VSECIGQIDIVNDGQAHDSRGGWLSQLRMCHSVLMS